jgi:hypothetical protein
MPEAETGTPTKATTLIIHFSSIVLLITYLCAGTMAKGKLKRQHRNKSKIHKISRTKGNT